MLRAFWKVRQVDRYVPCTIHKCISTIAALLFHHYGKMEAHIILLMHSWGRIRCWLMCTESIFKVCIWNGVICVNYHTSEVHEPCQLSNQVFLQVKDCLYNRVKVSWQNQCISKFNDLVHAVTYFYGWTPNGTASGMKCYWYYSFTWKKTILSKSRIS